MKNVARSSFAPVLALCVAFAGGLQSRLFAAEQIQQGGSSGARIWLQESQSLPVTYVGSTVAATGPAKGVVKKIVRDLSAEQAKPLSMTKGDCDQDGVEDLVVGYGTATGGTLVLHRGNLDAFAPQSAASFQAIAEGRFPSPFLKNASVIDIPVRPDFVAAGNFSGQNHLDLVVAAKGGNAVYVLAGDGTGKFAKPVVVNVQGAVTTLASGQFGSRQSSTHLIVE